jgi:hypothetical protein
MSGDDSIALTSDNPKAVAAGVNFCLNHGIGLPAKAAPDIKAPQLIIEKKIPLGMDPDKFNRALARSRAARST